MKCNIIFKSPTQFVVPWDKKPKYFLLVARIYREETLAWS